MDKVTVELHESIDENIRRVGRGYLSAEGESVTADLMGSARMVRWQEKKAAATLLGSFCWSELPQVYGRYGGESSRELVDRVKALEGAEAAVVTDSGMGAAAVLFDALLEAGDHVVVARSIYNKTKAYLGWLENRMGIALTLVDDDEVETLLERLTDRTRIVMVEIFTNPLMRAFDPRLVSMAREGRKRCLGLRLVVDDARDAMGRPHAPSPPGVDSWSLSGTKASMDGTGTCGATWPRTASTR
jgi:cystathionine beta-lyase/cystathionine gamma-synthase